MKLFKKLSMVLLLASVAEIYAMNNEDLLVADYKLHLKLEAESDTDIWKMHADQYTTRAMLKGYWAISRFNELSKEYSFDSAKSILNQEATTRQYEEHEVYKRWFDDKCPMRIYLSDLDRKNKQSQQK